MVEPPPLHETGPAVRGDPVRIRLLEMEGRIVSAEWKAEEVVSSYWRLYRNDRAGGAVQFAGRTMPLRAGRVYLIPPWVRFGYRTARPVHHLYLHFDVVDLPRGVLRAAFDRPLRLPDDAALRSGCAALRRALADHSVPPIANANRSKALIHLALNHALADADPEALRRWQRQTDAGHELAPAMRMIEHQLDGDLCTESLAHACHLSPRHFGRRFTRLTGQTPARYVRERRVTAAAHLLATTGQSIESVAQRCGFPNRYHLSRVFKQQTGVSPAAYRRAAVVDTHRR